MDAARTWIVALFGLSLGAACSSGGGGADGPTPDLDAAAPPSTADADAGAPCIKCGSSCVDVRTDAKHCGHCYNACADQFVCVNARCELPKASSVVLEEIYRAGSVQNIIGPTIFGVLNDVLHFRMPDNTKYACKKDSCASTVKPSSIEHGFFPTRATPYGYFAGGRYYNDPWLEQQAAYAVPSAMPYGVPRLTFVEAGMLFWGCGNQTSCPDVLSNTTLVQFGLYRCPSAGCADYSSAVLVESRSCFGSSSCLPHIHSMTVGPGQEWLLAWGENAFLICTPDHLERCWTLYTNNVVGSEFAISGDVIVSLGQQSRVSATFPSRSLDQVQLPDGLRALSVMSAGTQRRFILRGGITGITANIAASQYYLLSFDDKGQYAARVLDLQPAAGKPEWEVAAAADETHVYVMRVEQNTLGDRFIVLFRGKL